MEGFSKKIDMVADEFCHRLEDQLIKERPLDDEVDYCKVCPFANRCSMQQNGAAAFIRETLIEELKNYFE